jgi:hypothetical protein
MGKDRVMDSDGATLARRSARDEGAEEPRL